MLCGDSLYERTKEASDLTKMNCSLKSGFS